MSTLEAIGQGVGSKAAVTGLYGGATSAILAWAANADAVAWIGAMVAVAGLVANIYHRRCVRRMEAERIAIEKDRQKLEWAKYESGLRDSEPARRSSPQ